MSQGHCYKNFALVSIQEETLNETKKMPENQEGTIYTLGIKITSAEAHQTDLLTLNTFEFPNYYTLTHDMEVKGWAIGQSIFERQWAEAVKGFQHHWADTNLQNLADLANKISKDTGATAKEFISAVIPSNIQSLFIDAYFGHTWNAIVSQRLNMIGSQPQIGDISYSPNLSELVVINDKGTRVSTTPCRIVMPFPGFPPTESYSANALISSLYLSSFPKLTSPWFKARVKDYKLTTKYRPILCNPQNFEVNWLSDREFSLRFTLPNTNNVENILKGLETCLQLAGNQASPILFSSLELAPSVSNHGMRICRALTQSSSLNSKRENLMSRKNAKSNPLSLPSSSLNPAAVSGFLRSVSSSSTTSSNIVLIDLCGSEDDEPSTRSSACKRPKMDTQLNNATSVDPSSGMSRQSEPSASDQIGRPLPSNSMNITPSNLVIKMEPGLFTTGNSNSPFVRTNQPVNFVHGALSNIPLLIDKTPGSSSSACSIPAVLVKSERILSESNVSQDSAASPVRWGFPPRSVVTVKTET